MRPNWPNLVVKRRKQGHCRNFQFCVFTYLQGSFLFESIYNLHKSWSISNKTSTHTSPQCYIAFYPLWSFSPLRDFRTITVFDPITTHTPISAQSSNFIVFRLQAMYLILYKIIYCWYSFELPRQVEAIQMSTNNICFYKKCRKILRRYH